MQILRRRCRISEVEKIVPSAIVPSAIVPSAIVPSAIVFAIVLAGPGCQRLDDEEPYAPTSLGSNATGDEDDGDDDIFVDTGDDTGGDGANMSECEPVAQTGCVAGEKCTAVSGGSFRCVSATASNLEPYDACQPAPATGLDECAPKTVCAGTDASGVCLFLCESDGDCEGGLCRQTATDAIPYCGDHCSPFESLCPAPTACRRTGDRFTCNFLQESDVGGAGAACDQGTDAGCGVGFACITGALVPDCVEPACCTPLCDLSGADPCSSPATCTSVFDSAAPGFDTIGACFVPA